MTGHAARPMRLREVRRSTGERDINRIPKGKCHTERRFVISLQKALTGGESSWLERRSQIEVVAPTEWRGWLTTDLWCNWHIASGTTAIPSPAATSPVMVALPFAS